MEYANKTSYLDKTKKNRESNFELLRIVCMTIIVIYHCIVHGNVMARVRDYSTNWVLIQLLYPFLQVGVNCYILISGYYLCEKSFSVKRVLSIWTDTLFWSVFLRLLSIGIGHTEFGIVSAVKAILPITQREYWFVTSYLLMYLCSPFLNAAMNHLSQKQHMSCLLMVFSVFIVLQNITFWNDFSFASGHSPLFFVFLYITAAYIRKYPLSRKINWGLLFVLMSLVTAILDYGITVGSKLVLGYVFGGNAFTSFNSVPIFLSSLFLFLAFEKIDIKNKTVDKLVRFIAPSTFAVYLIHDHNDIRSLIWDCILKCSLWGGDLWMLVKVVAGALLVFAVCVLMDLLKRQIWHTLCIDKVLRKAEDYVSRIWDMMVDSLLRFNQ